MDFFDAGSEVYRAYLQRYPALADSIRQSRKQIWTAPALADDENGVKRFEVIDDFPASSAGGMGGDVCSGVVDDRQQVLRLLETELDEGDEVGEFGDTDHRRADGPQQGLVAHHATRAGDHGAPAARDRPTRLQHRLFDIRGHQCVSALPLKLLAHSVPPV